MHVALVSECVRTHDETTDAEGPHIASLANSLVRRGAKVDVYTRRQNPVDDSELIGGDGYRIIKVDAGPAKPLPDERILPCIGTFGSVLRDHWALDRPDVIHAHSWVPALASVLAAREVDSPAVVSLHELAQGGTSGVPRASLERKIARSADRLVASSSEECEHLTRLGVARSKISIVPTGFDPSMFAPSGAAEAKKSQRRRIVVDSSEPGVQMMIEILEKMSDVELVVLGTAPDMRRLRKVAASRKVTRRVVFTGPILRSDRPALLRSADLFVCTSSSEPSGIATMEAMACGVPVVAYGVGWMHDLVVDEVTGRLIDPPNRREFVRAIELLVADELQLFALGVSAADRVQSRYSWDRIADDMTRSYDATVRGHHDRSHPTAPMPEARRYAV
ncbi:glycosyltransferase [Rhodococcus sovatensis]|uniref:Glycosyltransferase n=1 Tax=Rhodococcus sovatensis TaxID=1805840 RepID=A0ABZ2PJU3_9NOCA